MSRAFCCNALDTPQGYISNKKNIPQKWGHESLGIGAKEPILGLIDCHRAQYVQVVMFQAPISRKGFIKLGGTLFGSFGTSTEPKKGHFGPKWALLRPPGNLGEAGYQAKVCGDHESYPGGPIGGNWDQTWSPGAL